MPIYEYVCPHCEVKFEKLRPLSQAKESATCPECKEISERVLSVFASFSKDESGLTSPVGGNSCSTCSSGSCSTCAM